MNKYLFQKFNIDTLNNFRHNMPKDELNKYYKFIISSLTKQQLIYNNSTIKDKINYLKLLKSNQYINLDITTYQELDYIISHTLKCETYDIISKLKNRQLLIEYITNNYLEVSIHDIFSIYKLTSSEIIDILENLDKKIIFNDTKIDYFKENISNLKYEDKIRFIKLLDIKSVYKGIELENNKDNILKDYSDKPINETFKDYTFGLEFETSNRNNQLFLALKQINKNWIIKTEGSVENGVEFNSPILHFTSRDLKEVKIMCNYLNKNGFKANSKCGGHIHIGFNSIKNTQELNNLYYLYTNCEKLIYMLLNKDYSLPREGVTKYAMTISDKIKNKEIFFNNTNLNELTYIIQTLQGNSKYYGINLLNANTSDKNTIEFRVPNGELDYNELIKNLLFIIYLINGAKKLTHLNESDKLFKEVKLLNKDIDDNQKVTILLNLLFDNKEIKDMYYERYINNSNFANINNNSVYNYLNYENTNLKIKTLKK